MDRHTPARFELLYTQTRTGHLFIFRFGTADISEPGCPTCALSDALLRLRQRGLVSKEEVFGVVNWARSVVLGGASA